MARIKGKWVGQIVIDYENLYGDPEKDKDRFAKDVYNGLCNIISWNLGMVPAINNGYSANFTVTQLHADLYRDEPSEWTKEEATP